MRGDCQFSFHQLTADEFHRSLGYVSSQIKVRDLRPVCTTSALTTGLERAPLFFNLFEGAGEGITSQIAVKMSRDAATERVMSLPETPASATSRLSKRSSKRSKQTAVQPSEADTRQTELNYWHPGEVVQEAYRAANDAVYEYGHRMLSGGKCAATGLLAVLDNDLIAVGRVGAAEAYLWRGKRLIRIFQDESGAANRASDRAGLLERFIGANSQILVDLASITVSDKDLMIFTTLPDSDELRETISVILSERAGRETASLQQAAKSVARQVAPWSVKAEGDHQVAVHDNVIVAILEVGPSTILLREAI